MIKYLLEKESRFNKQYLSIKDKVDEIFLCEIDLNYDLKNGYYTPFFRHVFADLINFIALNQVSYFNSISGTSRDSVTEQFFAFVYNKYNNPGELLYDNIKALLSDVLYGYTNSRTGLSEKDFSSIVKRRLDKDYIKKEENIVFGKQLDVFDGIDFDALEAVKKESTESTKDVTEDTETPKESTEAEIDNSEKTEGTSEQTDDTSVEEVVEHKEEEITAAVLETDKATTSANNVSDNASVGESSTDNASASTTQENDSAISSDVASMLDILSGSKESEETEQSVNTPTEKESGLSEGVASMLDLLSGMDKPTDESKQTDDKPADKESKKNTKKEADKENNKENVNAEGFEDVPFLAEDNLIINNNQDICLKYSMDLSIPGAIGDFENAVLKDRFMSIEAIKDKDGKEILIFRSRRGSVPFFHVYMDNKDCMDYIAPYLSRRSFVKICYQPYYLYSYCRKYNAPLKRVYSICTCHSLIMAEYTADDVSKLKVLSYRKTLESYLSEDWKENLPALLAGMSVYAYVTKKQEQSLKVIEKEGSTMLTEMDELVYYDEALGLSYCLDNLFQDTKTPALFKLTGHNEFAYVQITELKTKPAGKFVEFIIDTEFTKLEYAHQLVRGVIIDLVENGRFRKINMYVIDARNNHLRLFIPEYYFQHMMTILSSTFTSVARKLNIEHLTYKSVIKKADSIEGTTPVPAID